MNIKKFKKIKKIHLIKRKRNPLISRYGKIRLEKNERVSSYTKDFIEKIKSKFISEHISAYPEVEKIYSTLATSLGVKKDMIVITSGSDLAIKNCFELLISPGDEVISLSPTYGMVDIYSQLFEAKQIKIKYDENLHLNVEKLIKSITKKTNLVIIANPNSPTGTIISEKNLVRVISTAKKFNSFVLIDECYYGYYSKSCIKYIKKFRNLIISRSFSKIGLAGCRIGYLVASKKIADLLYKFRPFYEISSFSCLALSEILRSKSIINKYINETQSGKQFLMKEFKNLNIRYFKTNTNFILIKFNSKIVKEKIKKKLAQKNILVLGEGKLINGDKVLRITLGPKKYMKIVSDILKKFFKENYKTQAILN